MAVAYQIGAPPGSSILIADMKTKAGGPRVTIQNGHASEPLMVGGNENDVTVGGVTGSATSQSTGYRLTGGSSMTVILGAADEVWARGGGTTVTVSVMVYRTNGKDG